MNMWYKQDTDVKIYFDLTIEESTVIEHSVMKQLELRPYIKAVYILKEKTHEDTETDYNGYDRIINKYAIIVITARDKLSKTELVELLQDINIGRKRKSHG